MVTGQVVRFDRGRGFGFIAPDSGGDDVFVHANDLDEGGVTVACGTRVEFEIVDGGRGPKAYGVRILAGAESPEPSATGGPAKGVPVRAASVGDDECEILSEKEFAADVTELLISSAPTLTGVQVVEIRKALSRMARSHGWVD